MKKKYPFVLYRRTQLEEQIHTDIEADSWSEARDRLAKKCTSKEFTDSQWEEQGTAQTGSDYAVHIMHTGESKHEAAIQEMKEADEPIFKDCIWDGDYF
jgi:hypothetical protein|tara:strand:- start:324 stop:620 length:297 start_codon:yes stop_codon:yes gene_type:complete